VDGRIVRRGELVKSGFLDPALDYTDGAVGSFLSHYSLWEKAVREDRPITMCEDDAITNRGFDDAAQALLDSLAPDWDIVFWGWNFDAFAAFEMIPGVSPFVAWFDQDQMRNGVEKFQSAMITPRCFRLYAAFGVICYSVSPAGARALLELCVPVTNRPVHVPSVDRTYANRDAGIAVLEFLPRLNSFASFPPLAIAKNDHATSQNLNPI
jgi:GR25 family glycosyltransferase involved in LPS biosynthesis